MLDSTHIPMLKEAVALAYEIAGTEIFIECGFETFELDDVIRGNSYDSVIGSANKYYIEEGLLKYSNPPLCFIFPPISEMSNFDAQKWERFIELDEQLGYSPYIDAA